MALTSPGLRQGCSGESHPFLPNTLICFAGLIVVGRLVCFTLPSDRSDPTRPDKIFGSFRLLISRDPHVSPSRAATENKRFQKEENVQRAAALWGESGHFDSGFTALKWPPQWPDGAERPPPPTLTHPPTHPGMWWIEGDRRRGQMQQTKKNCSNCVMLLSRRGAKSLRDFPVSGTLLNSYHQELMHLRGGTGSNPSSAVKTYQSK